MNKRVCKKCGIEKPETNEFFIKNSSSKNGLLKVCKICTRDYQNNRRREESSEYKKNFMCMIPDGRYLCGRYWFVRFGTYHTAEHRHIMRKVLERDIEPHEHIHHVNGDKQDNRVENLKLLDGAKHSALTRYESELKNRIRALENENAYLRKKLADNGI